MQATAFVNLSTHKLSSSASGGTLTLPELVQGDEIKISLRFLQVVGGANIEVERRVNSIQSSIGFVDARPLGGKFGLSVDGQALPLELTHAATAEEVKECLGSLYNSEIEVTAVDGSWLIDIQDQTEAEMEITGESISLTPSSHVRVRSYLVGNKKRHELRLIQSPLASSSTFSTVVPKAPFVTRIQEGGKDESTEWPEIQALKINPSFRGSYQIRRGYKKSGELSIEDGAEEIAAAISSLADEGGSFTVTNPSNNTAHIRFDNSMSGFAQELLEVVVFSAPAGDPTFTLDLNTAEVAVALRSTPSTANAVLEVAVTLVDEDDPFSTNTVTPLLTPVKIIRELNWNGLEATANIDWLRPPHGRTYIPFTQDQIITGSQHYISPVGDGGNTDFTISHNLGTKNLHVTLRKNDAEGAIVDRQFTLEGDDLHVSYAVTLDSDNDLSIKFNSPPANNAYVATITTAGPKSAFQDHTHTIDQIEGLRLIIDDLGSRVQGLEDVIMVVGAGSNTDGGGEIILASSEILDITIPSASTSQGSRPELLGAIHSVTAQTLLPPFGPEHITGKVAKISTPWVIPSSRSRRSWPVSEGGYVATNGSTIYEVRKNGDSYYPVEYEHDLFMFWVEEEMLAPRKSLFLECAPYLKLSGNTRAQYMLEVSFGKLNSDEGENYGPNLSALQWAEPVIEQRIVLSSSTVQHPFSLSIHKAFDGILTSTSHVYNRQFNVTPPESSAFAVRARLLNFDTENRVDTRGVISLKVAPVDLKAK